MRRCVLVILVFALSVCTSAFGLEKKAYRMKEDFGTEPLQDCYLQYYYYIPCPTFSWFWGFYDWSCGDIVGEFFIIGDASTGGLSMCDSLNCHHLMGIRVLDFAGYGTMYPGLFTVEFDVYCSDGDGCPIGTSLWNSGPIETHANWNTITIDPPLPLTECCVDSGPPASSPRILVTATHTGSQCTYPQWGLDNISGPLMDGCDMHDAGCLPALYPRPSSSHYSTIHSGYYGTDFAYCPPQWFLDGADTTVDGSIYGYLEFAWRLLIACLGPEDATDRTTWGSVKSLYR